MEMANHPQVNAITFGTTKLCLEQPVLRGGEITIKNTNTGSEYLLK